MREFFEKVEGLAVPVVKVRLRSVLEPQEVDQSERRKHLLLLEPKQKNHSGPELVLAAAVRVVPLLHLGQRFVVILKMSRRSNLRGLAILAAAPDEQRARLLHRYLSYCSQMP